MTVGEGTLRARKLEVDKFNALQAFYAGIPKLGSTAQEALRHPRTTSGAKDRPRRKMTAKQERARLQVSSRVLQRAQPRRHRTAFWAAHVQRLQRLADARAPQP